MPRKISVRKDMTGAGGTITDGTEIAYTTHDYTTINTGDPTDYPYNRNQSGALNDSPQYLKRNEWWQGKTDDNGNPDPNPTTYEYSRTTGSGTETDTVTYPPVVGGQLTVSTTTDTITGSVTQIEYKNGASVLRKAVYTYTTGPDGGSQIATVETFDEANASTKVEYGYESYGRVKNIYEYGYKNSGSFKVRRRTRYDYSNTQAHLDAKLLRLVTEVRVYDGLLDNDNNNDVLKSDTVFSYDNYVGGIEYYGLTSGSYPPNHDSAFDQNNTARGNVTGVQTFSSISPAVSTTRNTKYDVFGNVVEADVSCCQVKTINFKDDAGAAATYYSQPMSVISGRDGVVPFLKTKYQYDFNTGLATTVVESNGLTTTFGYDSAGRLQTVNAPGGAVMTTQLERDANGNDQLVYSEKGSFTENGSSKVITSKSWLDGAGRVLRSGSGAGLTPTSYDVVATVYDRLGRVLKQSNPYSGDSSGNGSPSYWTTNSYDLMSRVTQVKLPDNQTITTSFAGAAPPTGGTVTVTDQVGRKRKSETDGLGRTTSLTEQDPATGSLSWGTTYSYDALDNLTQVNQASQLRTFSYDALSRLISQTTPEAGLVSFAYTTSSSVLKRTDARGVETHYKYDNLNRALQVWYTGVGGSDDPLGSRPALPSGVAATPDVTMSYNNFSSAQVGNGLVSSVTDAAGNESYSYDTLSRLSSKTRIIDSRSYQTQYLYNTASQATTFIYPSGKRVRTNHDGLGRMNGLDKVDSSGNVLANYMSSVGYNTAGQVTSIGLANGANESYGYSADRLQLTSQSVTKGSTLMSLTYGYGASSGQMGATTTTGNPGQLVSIAGSVNGVSRNQAFSYDNVGRVVTATGWSAWNRRFSYDRWGNRTGMWDAITGGNQLQSVSIATSGSIANNRIANVNGVTYTYDASGNVTWDGAHSYAYDGEGRQANVDAGATATNVYDSNNWRLKKVSGGTTTHYIWAGAEVIAEYNGATGALNSEYVYGGSRMIARDQGGVLRYYYQDRLSTRLIADASGAVVGTQDTLPFGEDGGFTGETEKHRFTSYERDTESNTDYAVNRQQQFADGKFMQPDPIAGSMSNPQSFNRYAYATNDPINSVDPLGLWSLCFWNFKDVSNGDGPARWELSDVDCIDFPDPFVSPVERGGGAGKQKPQPKKKTQRCSEIANLASANTDVGLLSRLVFAEGTGSYVFDQNYSQIDTPGMSRNDGYARERYTIASTVYNRVAFLSQPGNTMGTGARGSSVSDVIGGRGASGQQYRGFQYNKQTGQVDISKGIQGEINGALNSPVGSNQCNGPVVCYLHCKRVSGRKGSRPVRDWDELWNEN
jgi:RHS repeat-associated protein